MDSGAGGGDTTLPWPGLQTSLALEGEGGCIARARHLAADFLLTARSGHGVAVSDRAVDLTQLVVSELVTNACKYAPGPILLHLRITGEAVEVVVWDSNPGLPAARAADADRIGQHGLEIVTALAEKVEVAREPVGKRVTARITLTDTDR
ncbi:ATP-binding protein [Streptomyces sp. SLBN-31]|uniref:ATP-binding protein n=1 Tax=Streptomyces sp. SLBN-31 TaxID=2768444 RepID=UPI0011509B27|nr:ATP-binding protein [Streptomyces sp. SLBN-31]TQJ92952.1 anti-sigma regulatory factor (Ser/Thr protein kinase) [Streptomyces sp. SLBN-31]